MAENGRVNEAQQEMDRLRRRARRRMQEAREELERFSRRVREQAASEELGSDLEEVLDDLRHEVESLDTMLRQRAENLVQDVEKQAKRVEVEIEAGLDDATEAVRRNPWRVIFAALVLGLVIGILLRGRNAN